MPASSVDADRRLSAEGLRDLLAIINSSRGLDEILEYLVVQAHQVLGSDGVGLYLHDPTSNALVVQAAHGVPADLLDQSAPIGLPVIELAVARRRSVVVTDVAAAVAVPAVARLDQQVVDRGTYLEVFSPGQQSQYSAHDQHDRRLAGIFPTIAAVPLVAHDRAFGALVLYYHAAHAYGAEQVDLSLAFAQQAALAIENARLRAEAEQRFIEIERRQHVAEALRDLLAVVNSSHDLGQILSEVLAQSSRLLGNDGSAVYLRDDDDSDMLRVRAALGLESNTLAMEVRIGSPTTGLAVQQARTLVCEDLAAALASEATATELQDLGTFGAVMSTPLIARGRVFGAITLFYRDARAFSPEEIDLARAFAEQATLAIENARLHVEAAVRMRENERRRRVAEGMRDLLASVNSTRSLDEIMDLVLQQAAALLGSDAGSVLLLDDRENESRILTVRASRALVSDIVPTRLPVGTAITGVAVEQARAIAVSDLLAAVPVQGLHEPLFEDRGGFLKMVRVGSPTPNVAEMVDVPRVRDIARYYRALLAVPLAVRGRMHGAITLYYRRPRDFSSDDVRLAEAFADQTALAIENARLHAQTVRRSRDLEALYRADEALHRSLRLDQVLQALVDVAADVLEADATSVMIWDDAHERLIAGATRGFHQDVVARMNYAPGEGLTGQVALTGESIAVEEVAHDPRVAHQVAEAEAIHSVLHVPVKVNGEIFGVFGVAYRTRRPLAGDEERVMIAMAHRAAVAIENARLFAESEHRLHELEALYRADETLHRSLRPEDVMQALADVAAEVLHADKASVHVWDSARRQLVVAASFGYGPESMSQPLIPGEDIPLEDVFGSSVIAISDAQTDARLGSANLREIVERENVQAVIAAPISVSGQEFGLFAIAFCQQHTPTDDEQRLVQALAQRTGLAMQNARLFEQAQQVATAEERQRLARELHDAVTQTLFSASLIAEVAPRLWERNPNEARVRLEELRRLTRGALAEMRTLLLELRPAALVETPFAQLLRQLAEASASRTNLTIEVEARDDDGPLPPEVQIALYRIAQETLNNTSKHAGARRATVQLRIGPGGVDLHLVDDGRGFDPSSTPPGHLGLAIMQERARAIGARLHIESSPGGGTRVHVHWRGVSTT